MTISTYMYLLQCMRLYEHQEDDDYYCDNGDEENPEEAADTRIGMAFFATSAYEPGF